MARLLLLLTLAIVAGGCATRGTDPVTRAEEAAAHGDYTESQHLCEAIVSDSASFDTLTVDGLCRLARLLASLPGDQEANDGMAVRCLNRARTVDSDSVDAFLTTVGGDDIGHLITLDRVGAYLGIPRDELVADEDTDTAPSDTTSVIPSRP